MPNTSTSSPLRTRLLKTLGRKEYSPLDRKQLAQTLKLTASDKAPFKELLLELEAEGKIARIRKDRWILPDEASLVTGVLMFHERGHATLIPNDEARGKLHVDAEDTGVALHQDLVVVREDPPSQASRRRGRPGNELKPTARVIRILRRRRENYVGTLQRSGKFFYVVPDDPRYIQNFYVPDPRESNCIPKPHLGDKVVCRLSRWESRHVNPEGEIIERLGRPGDPGVDILSIIRKHNLSTEFPSEALAEVGEFSNPEGDAPFDEKDSQRLDLRRTLTFTIDPKTAKDFDDAIHIIPKGKNRWEVGVHIADVSHYVERGSALDLEARRRSNSVYLVNQVIPMLPEELSNGLCSLNPHVDRLTFSVIAEIDDRGTIHSYKITPSVIHSRHRLTYEEAMDILSHPPESEIASHVHEAWKIASGLRKKRFQEGALDLEMPEVKVNLNEHGEPVEIERVEYDESHQLIEEFMLMANEVVALELRNKHIPAVFRVHEAPDPEKLQEYRETLAIHGIRVGDLTQSAEVRKALRQVSERPDGHALKVGFLRSLKKADYRPAPIGHYGLAKANYTHFTSPIRRYADLIVHRALKARKRLFSQDQLQRTALHISEMERIASDAEFESVKLKKLEFFSRQLELKKPDRFKALIMDVMNFGMFVELPDSLVSGLVHVSSLEGDFYHYEERDRMLRGKRTKTELRVGQMITVEVERVDMFKQQIDFCMVSDDPAAPRRKGRSNNKGRSQGRKSNPHAARKNPPTGKPRKSRPTSKTPPRGKPSNSASRDSSPGPSANSSGQPSRRSSGRSRKRSRRR